MTPQSKATIFHVARGGWDGAPLRPMANILGWDDDVRFLAAKMAPDVDTAAYFDGPGQWVHCWATLAEAEAYAAEHGGPILEISLDILEAHSIEVSLAAGPSGPHPVVRGSIPSDAISHRSGDAESE